MNLKLKAICFFSLAAISVFCQNTFAQNQKQLQEALALFNLEEPTEATDQEALRVFTHLSNLKVSDDVNAHIAALSSQKAGVLLHMNGLIEEAKSAYYKSLHISEVYGLSDSLYFSSLLYLGGLYYSDFAFDSSYVFLSKAEQLYTQNTFLPEAGRLFNMLGVLYFETGDYRQSIPYFQKAIELRKDNADDDYALKVNLAIAHHQQSNSQKALKIYRELEATFPEEQELLINMAAIYLDQGQITEAEAAIEKISQLKANKLKHHLLKVRGELELKRGNYSKALVYFKESIKRNRAIKGPVVGDLWMNMGEVYYKTGEYAEALKHFQKAIIALSTNFDDSTLTQNPTQFTESYASYLLMQALAQKANVFKKLYELKTKKYYSQAAADSYEATLKLAAILSKKYNSEASRIDFTQRIHDYYSTYTELLLASGKLEKAFEVSDLGKAAVLSVSLSESSYSQNIPDSLLQKERFLSMRHSALLRKQSDTNEDLGKEISGVQLQLSQLNRSISTLRGSGQSEEKHLKVPEIKSHLASEEAFLSFYEGSAKLGIFLITDVNFSYHELGNVAEFKALKSRLTTLRSFGKTDRKALKTLYSKIVNPIVSQLQEKRMLMVSSDGVFHGVPFEVLIDEEDLYLIQNWAVEYIFNSSFLRANNAPINQKLLAMAPFSEKTDKFDKWFLPESAKEIADLDGDKLFNSDAQKETFLKQSSQYGIIHLTTHAKAHETNTDLSYIQFYPSNDTISKTRLYLHELRPGSLQNPLVFLSACETYGADVVPGEGIRGLCYGFTRAGASGIISSLWNAEDHSTAALSQLFYKFLDQGNSAPVALQKAKIAFLKNPDFVRFHNPSYWGHLVYTGHQSYKSNYFAKNHLLFTVILILIYFALKRRI